MKAPFLLLFLLPIICGSCLKDEVDIDALTTNPLDPDYTGPALIELDSASTRIVLEQGVPPDTAVVPYVHVRTDLLAPGTPWDLYIVKENTGELIDLSSDVPQPDVEYHHAQLGTNYCWSYRLKVRYSLTKEYRFCTTAAL